MSDPGIFETVPRRNVLRGFCDAVFVRQVKPMAAARKGDDMRALRVVFQRCLPVHAGPVCCGLWF